MNFQTLITLTLFVFLLIGCEEEGPYEPLVDLPTNETNTPPITPPPSNSLSSYTPLGVGGGGAMSGVAISPYSDLRFVGTDMGTLFRSADKGEHWEAVNHFYADYDSRLELSVSPGFSSDGVTVFHASAGVDPKKSSDSGITFTEMNMPLGQGERIVYWSEDTQDENLIFAGTNSGLLVTNDKGVTWSRTQAPALFAKGTFIDHENGQTIVYHATEDEILKSTDLAQSFTSFYNPTKKIRMFTAGRDSQGITFAISDDDGNGACAWAMAYINEWGQNSVNQNLDTCGYVWIKKNQGSFTKTTQAVGDHFKMAANDSQTIYVTGGKLWIRQYGTKVHLSEDGGSSWDLKLHQLNWDTIPFEPWPQSKIEYSAVAIDVGWWDDGYESFEINKLNSSEIAGAGWFFLHHSFNKGNFWNAPFTQMKDAGVPTYGKRWQTQGIEVISVYNIKHHPTQKDLIYAATADIGGMVSDDNGETFRLCKAKYNSNYDYAFDPNNTNLVYAASGNSHDYPITWHAGAIKSNGGIYQSNDRGMSWTRLTPSNSTWNRQFLSIAYDHRRNTLYGGTHGYGIARSTDNGSTWNWLNNGLPSGDRIIPQLTIDPDNGNMYAMLAGDYGVWSNRSKTGIYYLDVVNGSTTWQLLRTTVHYPPEADSGYKVWWYPIKFAVDFKDPQRNTLWLVDYENNGNWLMTGVWKSTDRGLNWHRKVQFTHPSGIEIDPSDSDTIYVSGFHELNGQWGNGGQMFTTDGGETWKKNLTPNLQHNGFNSMIDPTNPDNIFYTYFGGGILKGPNPTRKPAAVKLETVD